MVNGKISLRIMSLGLFLVVLLGTGVSLIQPSVAHAVSIGDLSETNGAALDTGRYGPILDHQLYFFLVSCFANAETYQNGGYSISSDQMSNYDFFEETTSFLHDRTAVRGAMYEESKPSCGDEQFIQEAVNSLGWSEPYDFICSLSFSYNAYYGGNGGKGSTPGSTQTKSSCLSGKDNNANTILKNSSSIDWVSEVEKILQTKPEGQAAVKALSNPDEYIRAYRTLAKRCDVKLLQNLHDSPQDFADGSQSIPLVQADGSVEWWKVNVPNPNQKNDYVATRAKDGVQIKTCQELVTSLYNTYKNYSDYVMSKDGDIVTPLDNNCGSSAPGECETKSSCTVEGIGWIVCPVLNFIATINDAAYAAISNFLEVDITMFADDGVLPAWQSFRDIANVAFIIAILIIVYSQITGVGVTNYGIKRLLPRLIIAAILVNLSYIITQFAVDLSNILGNSVAGLLGDFGTAVAGSSEVPKWATVTTDVLLGGAAVIAVLAILFCAAPSVLFILGAILLLLIARKAALIILIAISPLAFVAYLLPNTEQWFTKWRKLFVAMLMVYPIIGLLFGGGELAAKIIANSGGTFEKILAVSVAALPLFGVLTVLKGALNGLGVIGAKINGFSDKGVGRGMSGVKSSRLGEAKAAWDARSQARKVRRRLGKGLVASAIDKRADHNRFAARLKALNVGRMGAALDQTRFGGYIGGERGAAAATAAYHKAAHEETERQEALYSESTAEELLEELHKGGSAEKQAAVLRRIVKSGGDQHVQAAYDYLAKHAGEAGVGDAQQLAADALLSRKPAGVSSEDAHSLTTGKFNLGDDGKPVASGYMDMLAKRVKSRKMGPSDYARMQKDDLVRLAELSKSGALDDTDRQHINYELGRIMEDETLKGTVTGERRALFTSISIRSGPMSADGTPREPLTPI